VSRLNRFTGSFLARLAIGYVLVAAVFAATWLWSLYGPLTRAAVRQQQSNLTAVAQSAALVAAESSTTANQIAEQLVARTDLRLTIVGSDGIVLADSNFNPATMENHARRVEIAAALAGQVGTDRRISRTEGVEELYVAVPASLNGQRVALRVSQPLAEIESIAARSRRVGLLLLCVAMVITFAIAVQATRKAAEPVLALSEAAERMAAGDLSTEIPSVPTDLEALAQALTSLRSQMRSRISALETEKKTLAATLNGLADAVFVFEDERVRFANTAADAMFRTPSSGWRGTKLEAAGLPGALETAIRNHTGSSETAAVELEPDPLGRSLRVLIAPLDPSDVSGRTIVAVSDITQRVCLDGIRRDFVANASHELKTPVAGIRLLAQSVETAASDGNTDLALAFASQIEAETGRLQRLVGDLLDLSRLETAPAAGAVTDVRLAVDNAVVSHRGAAARKGVALEVDLSEVRGSDVFAAAEPTDIAIALDNLLDNAIAYTDAGSVRLAVTADAQCVRIAVSDTGRGIALEHQPRVFERFYRVDRGRSRDSGGTGLGLALVRHVVERSGGTVSLLSSPGEGSTFTLEIPRAV